MKTRILAVALVFCIALNGFAQKKDDDNKPCTRGQLAQLIVDTLPWVKELPDVNKKEKKYQDVDDSHPNYEAIILVTKKGIIEGLGRFSPDYKFNRYILSLFLSQLTYMIETNFHIEFRNVNNYFPHERFTDGIIDSAEEAVMKLIRTGIIMGYPDGTFKGKQPATIKEVKLVLQRIKEKTEALLKEKGQKLDNSK